MSYIKTISHNARVFHREHGPGRVIGSATSGFVRAIFDKDEHLGAAGVREVHPRNLSPHKDDL
jgi:hypothetical protein